MEAAGLAFGVVVIVKPLCETIHETLSDYRGFGKEAERLRLRFAVQQTRLESMERLLFEEGKHSPYMPGRLVDRLKEGACSDLLALLKQLQSMLVEYAAVRKQYDLTGSQSAEDANMEEVAAMSPEERSQLLVAAKNNTDAKKQAAFGWARKMLWVAFDRSSTEKLVTEFEAWTDRTQTFLEAAWWPNTFFDSLDRMRKLEEDSDARNAGLLRGIGVRKLLVTPPALVSTDMHASETTVHTWHMESRLGSFELGCLREEGMASMNALVEYKQYTHIKSSKLGDTAIRQRVVQLAALLHEAQASDSELRVLKCVRYFEETPKSRFGLVYAMPSAHPPVTLANLLDVNQSSSRRPSLSVRLQLAHKIALSVRRLHAYRWVHKSLRSENIIFFVQVTPSQSCSAPVSEPASHSLDDPKLIGFEYARREKDFSDQFGESEIKRNIYRHPARWGDPTERFDRSHDLYALGVLLLEIGLWSRADQLDNGSLVKNLAHDPEAVRARLLRHADMRIGFYAGDRYRDAVLGCLNGTVNDIPIEDAFSGIVENLEALAKGMSMVA